MRILFRVAYLDFAHLNKLNYTVLVQRLGGACEVWLFSHHLKVGSHLTKLPGPHAIECWVGNTLVTRHFKQLTDLV